MRRSRFILLIGLLVIALSGCQLNRLARTSSRTRRPTIAPAATSTPEGPTPRPTAEPGAKPTLESNVKSLIIYQIWLNYYGPGAIKNAEAHLDNIAALGVNMIQLSPIQAYNHRAGQQPATGAPYGPVDYYAVDSGYGILDDLKNFVAHAHSLGLKVILDEVIHSTPDTSSLLKEHPEYYQRDASGNPVLSPYGHPLLDYSNPATMTYITDMLKWWLANYQVDGFRFDVAGSIDPQYWVTIRDSIKEAFPNAFMLAEVGNGRAEVAPAFDATYGYDWLFTMWHVLGDTHTYPASQLKESWDKANGRFPQGNVFLRAIDVSGNRVRSVESYGNDAVLAAEAINFTIDGIPFIFNGLEIGDTVPTAIRPPITPISWDNPSHPEDVAIYTKFSQIRKAYSALTQGSVQWITNSNSDSIVSYTRKDATETILVVANLSGSAWSGTVNFVPSHQLIDLMTGEPAQAQTVNNQLQVSLGAYQYLIAVDTPQ